MKLSWMKAVMLGSALSLVTACQEDESVMGRGEVSFEITDAPVDDANVKGVIVTIVDVKVDGKSIEGFTKQSIDLTAYQNGETFVLGNMEMDARSYSNVKLVLDVNEDEQGNSPGCYVLDQSNIKYQLKSTASGTMELALSQAWTVAANAKTNMVMDFDLRKALRYSDDASIRYQFVNESNLNAAVRVVTKQSSGTIKGSYENSSMADAEKVIVYAYKKGTFNASTETQPQGTDGIQFKNAISSGEVKSGVSGSYFTLAYLPEGEYELHFAAYSKNASTGRMSFDAMLQAETSVEGDVANVVRVKANATALISSSIKGII